MKKYTRILSPSPRSAPAPALHPSLFTLHSSLLSFLFLALFALSPPAHAQTTSYYDKHVLFDNSPTNDGGHAYSTGHAIAPSTLELIDGRVPVEANHFVSPPNSLRLQWKSILGGDWSLGVEIPRRYARTFKFEGDTFNFWIYPEKTDITQANSPCIYLRDRNDHGTRARPLVLGDKRIPAGKWTKLSFTFKELNSAYFPYGAEGTDDSKFVRENLAAVVFMQGIDDGEEHTIYVDDFHITDSTVAAIAQPPAAPTAFTARGQERHVDLAWSAPAADPQRSPVLSYRIYRSLDDGKTYAPIGTQQCIYTRYEDFLGAPNLTASYRVTAVDLAGNESPQTDAAQATTRPFTDDELKNMTQEACFRYYWDAGHPKAGLAPEVMPGDPNLLAMGGSGFGVMAIVTGAERKYVTREQAAERMQKIVRFLSKADCFHGVWPHFLNGETGKTIALFGKYDNGGDLVETAFMIQGLLVARQYFDRDNATEKEVRDTITKLWREVEWDWYRQRPDSPVLYWHWSPDHGFHINHPLVGWNEAMIVYLLAIASPTHPVPASLWHTGWAGTDKNAVQYRRNWTRTTIGDHYLNGGTYYGIKLEVGGATGTDLFFTHFSFMGFDPRAKRDRYTNYYNNNRAIALINHAYCAANPGNYKGYGPDCWGLSAGINGGGGRAQPSDDNGTINVMASLASMPYTPDESLAALKHFYRDLGAKVWGIYGFHDGFNETQNWFEEVYMALNQAPITVMIENQRSGLIWKNFMANPEIQPALDAIGFKPDTAQSATSKQ